MTSPTNGPPPLMIVLRQVNAQYWCVVRWRHEAGKFAFAGRIATARPYTRACSEALTSGMAERLPVAVCASGSRVRPFNPKRDVMQEPTA